MHTQTVRLTLLSVRVWLREDRLPDQEGIGFVWPRSVCSSSNSFSEHDTCSSVPTDWIVVPAWGFYRQSHDLLL